MGKCENKDIIPPITELTKEDLQYWLSIFILEVRNSLRFSYVAIIKRLGKETRVSSKLCA